jgi:hypothetical protein
MFALVSDRQVQTLEILETQDVFDNYDGSPRLLIPEERA